MNFNTPGQKNIPILNSNKTGPGNFIPNLSNNGNLYDKGDSYIGSEFQKKGKRNTLNSISIHESKKNNIRMMLGTNEYEPNEEVEETLLMESNLLSENHSHNESLSKFLIER